MEKIAERVVEIYGIRAEGVWARGRQQQRVRARSLFLHRLSFFFWMLILLGNCRVEGQMTREEEKATSRDAIWTSFGWDKWDTVDPFTFLDLLKKRPKTPLFLSHAPKDWIQERHMEGLVALVDSTEPASATCHLASAHLPPKGFHSTIGQEAARMICYYRRGWSYPGNCSDLGRVDVQEIKRCWRKE